MAELLGMHSRQGNVQLYTWLLQPLILSLLEKVPWTQLIFCCFQMGSQLGHSKHMPSCFYSLPSERDNCFFSSLDSV